MPRKFVTSVTDLSDTNTALEWKKPMNGRTAEGGEHTIQLTKEFFDCRHMCHEFPFNEELPIGVKTPIVT